MACGLCRGVDVPFWISDVFQTCAPLPVIWVCLFSYLFCLLATPLALQLEELLRSPTGEHSGSAEPEARNLRTREMRVVWQLESLALAATCSCK